MRCLAISVCARFSTESYFLKLTLAWNFLKPVYPTGRFNDAERIDSRGVFVGTFKSVGDLLTSVCVSSHDAQDDGIEALSFGHVDPELVTRLENRWVVVVVG